MEKIFSQNIKEQSVFLNRLTTGEWQNEYMYILIQVKLDNYMYLLFYWSTRAADHPIYSENLVNLFNKPPKPEAYWS